MSESNQVRVQQTEQGLLINPEAFVQTLPILSYRHEALYIEEVSVDKLVQTYGSPLYVYSKQAIVDAYNAYRNSFSAIDHHIFYSVKANSNLAVLSVLVQIGAGFDIVSIGELERVLAAGGEASNVVYSGVGKTPQDIERALQAGIACFNVESVSEIDTIAMIAERLNVQAPISLRVNPDVDAQTHPYISTGLKDNKFGIGHEQAFDAYQQAANYKHIDIIGIDFHIGSQLLDAQPFADALDKVMELITDLKAVGIELSHVDLGGGLGVQYLDEEVVSIADFAQILMPKLQELGLPLFLEPGRSIVANAGILLTQVNVLKSNEHKSFAIVDAAMNDLIRPALYQAQMAVIPAVLSSSLCQNQQKSWDIVGAVCETGDFLAKGRLLSLSVGDILAVTGVGAYGFVMSSNYNTRPRAAEVMVFNNQHQLVRKREQTKALYADESLWEMS